MGKGDEVFMRTRELIASLRQIRREAGDKWNHGYVNPWAGDMMGELQRRNTKAGNRLLDELCENLDET